MADQQMRELGSRFFMEQDRLRGGPLEELCAEGYNARIGGSPAMDLTAHQRFSAMFYRAFPDLRHAVEQVVVEDERVAVEFTLYGTHADDFMGMQATGRPITVSAMAILRCEGGRVIHLRGLFDHSALMQQIARKAMADSAPLGGSPTGLLG